MKGNGAFWIQGPCASRRVFEHEFPPGILVCTGVICRFQSGAQAFLQMLLGIEPACHLHLGWAPPCPDYSACDGTNDRSRRSPIQYAFMDREQLVGTCYQKGNDSARENTPPQPGNRAGRTPAF